jgi:mRNA interferase MazF
LTRGTLVLSPFPFTDLSGRKVRPCLIVSRTDRKDNDVIVAFLTTQGTPQPETDLVLETSDPNFWDTGLKTRSIVKLDKVVTIEKSVLLGELGQLSPAQMVHADQKLGFALDLHRQTAEK